MHPIALLQKKITRGVEHLHTLEQELNRFTDRKPYEIYADFEAEHGDYIYRIKVLEDVPISARLLTGEVVTHFRSALDHLAWQLALLSGPEPHTSTQFPIFNEAATYARDSGKQIKSISGHIKEIIDRQQPCSAAYPNRHPLWLLHRFANIDKHRVMSVVVASVSALSVKGDSIVGDFDLQSGPLGPLENQAEIARLRLPVNSSLEAYQKAEVHFGLGLIFEPFNEVLAPVVQTLHQMGAAVEGVIRNFEHLFPPR